MKKKPYSGCFTSGGKEKFKIQILHQDVAKTAIVFILKIKSWGNKKINIHQICIRDKSIRIRIHIGRIKLLPLIGRFCRCRSTHTDHWCNKKVQKYAIFYCNTQKISLGWIYNYSKLHFCIIILHSCKCQINQIMFIFAINFWNYLPIHIYILKTYTIFAFVWLWSGVKTRPNLNSLRLSSKFSGMFFFSKKRSNICTFIFENKLKFLTNT